LAKSEKEKGESRMSSEKLTFQPAPCSCFDEVISYYVYRPVFGGADEMSR